MQIKKKERNIYGMTYRGSKSRLIERIARFFPDADNWYDLFGGGFSVTHYMLMHRTNSYDLFHYNELEGDLVELIKDVIAGGYCLDKFKPEWISRERFFKEKDQNAYIRILWSFNNNQKTYCYNKDDEEIYKSLHQAIVFDDFNEIAIKKLGFDKWPNKLSIYGKKRVVSRKLCFSQEHIDRIERLSQLSRLKSLEQKMRITSLDYREVEIKKNSVIYCDIPYRDTEGYLSGFNHEEFFDWANEQKNPVFISEYDINDKRFFLLKSFSFFTNINNKKRIEKLYGNALAYEIINDALFKKHLENK